MDYVEFIDSIDRLYEETCNSTIHKYKLSAQDLKEFKNSNRELRQNLFFQDYLRIHTLAAIEIYHDYLREKLIDVAQIDIGSLIEDE